MSVTKQSSYTYAKPEIVRVQSGETEREDLNIVVIRAVACVLVILVHVSGWNFYQFSENWWPTNFYDSLARVCVPLFFMISGAMLLRKDEPLSVFLRKRPLRLAAPLLFWSVAYLLFYKLMGQGSAHIHGGWLKTILRAPVEVHLWYLYAALGLYAFIPLLRKMYSGSSDSEKRYYLALWFICAALYPTATKYFQEPYSFVDVYYLQQFTTYSGYFFLGAYLYDGCHKVSIKSSRWGWGLLFVVCSAITMLATYWYSVRIGQPHDLFYNYLSPFVVLAAAGAFGYFLRLQVHSSSMAMRSLKLVSRYSLGIYCIHLLTLQGLTFARMIFAGSGWWTIPVNVAMALLGSLAIVMVLRKLPLMHYVT